MARTLVALFYDKDLKYSLNPLIASIDGVRNAHVVLIKDWSLLKQLLCLNTVKEKYRCRVLGFSLTTVKVSDDEYRGVLEETLSLASRNRFVTVAGGPHASGDPVDTLCLGFKYVVVGEGEDAFNEFVLTLSEGLDPLSVKGLFTIVNGKPRYTGRRGCVNLDDKPPFPHWRGLFNPIEIMRGCRFGCKYCQVSYMHGFNERFRSIDNVLNYCRLMVGRGIRDLRFIAPNSLAYGSNVEKVYDLLDRLHNELVVKNNARLFYGTFPSEVRPDFIDEDLVKFMKNRVSNKGVIIGAQSGSEDVLKTIKRGHGVNDVYRAVEILVKNGFKAIVDFMVGFPFEGDDDYRATLNAVTRIVGMGGRIHMHTFIPLPGSPFGSMNIGSIPVWFRKEIARLTGAGGVYGEWIKQEEVARRVVKYRLERLIMKRRHLVEPGFRDDRYP